MSNSIKTAALTLRYACNLHVTGGDVTQRMKLAQQVEDLCKLNPSVCHGNMGLSREEMPQIEANLSVQELMESGDPEHAKKAQSILSAGGKPGDTLTVLDLFLSHLADTHVRIVDAFVPVGNLKATQAEIHAPKVQEMAANYLNGSFPDIGMRIIVSEDRYILDGHHRWAALFTIDMNTPMMVCVVGLPMTELLARARSFPGVYSADLTGAHVPASMEKQARDWDAGDIASRFRSLRKELVDMDTDYGQWFKPHMNSEGKMVPWEWDELRMQPGHPYYGIPSTWAQIFKQALPIAMWVLETRSIPSGKAKLIEIIARSVMSIKRAPNNPLTWWMKYGDGIKYLVQTEHWDEKQAAADTDDSGEGELFKLGPFMIHNTMHLTGAKLDGTKEVIQKAITSIQHTGAPLNKVLYGPVHLVGKLQKARTLAWYYIQDDDVYLRPHLKIGLGDVHNLIHELGHRFWNKFMPGDGQRQFRTDYYLLKNTKIDRTPLPAIGDVFTIPFKGREEHNLPVVMKYDGRTLEVQTPGETFTFKFSVETVLSYLRSHAVDAKFPSPYAATAATEYFAECFAFYCMGTLEEPHKEYFEKACGIK